MKLKNNKRRETVTRSHTVYGPVTLSDLRDLIKATEDWPGETAVLSGGYLIRYMEVSREEASR